MGNTKFSHLFSRGVSEVIRQQDLENLLANGKPLRLKMGFDPSRSDIHLGHVVGLRKLRQFQELGHKVILVVGDWTAQIGDPSGQSATRQMLTAQEVNANAQTYMDQFFKVVDHDLTEVKWQSEWFGEFNLTDVISLTSKFTVAQLLARDDFSKRYGNRKPIAITEFLYPLLQAYDSVKIEADVEFGGTDQRFNLLLGRDLQTMYGQRPQQCFLVPILVGTEGVHRMSKSLGNYIGIDETPKDIYFKVMRLKDDLMVNYFELVTDVDKSDLAEIKESLSTKSASPIDIKKRLASEIVSQFHGFEAAALAQSTFERIVQRKEAVDTKIEFSISFAQPLTGPNSDAISPMNCPANIETSSHANSASYSPKLSIPKLLVKIGAVSSGAEARRLIKGGGVSLNGSKIDLDGINIGIQPTPAPSGSAGSGLIISPNSTISAGKKYLIHIVDIEETV